MDKTTKLVGEYNGACSQAEGREDKTNNKNTCNINHL